MAALEEMPEPDLTGAEVLMLTGVKAFYGQYAPELENWLRTQGADLDVRRIEAGHDLMQEDLAAAKFWLTQCEEQTDG